MKESISSISKWHEETFLNETLQGQVNKFEEEKEELKKEVPNTRDWYRELADMFIVACGVSRFHALTAMFEFKEIVKIVKENDSDRDEFEKTVDEKMEINRNRNWSKSGEGKYQHK